MRRGGAQVVRAAIVVGAAAALVLVAAGCGSDENVAADGPSTTTTPVASGGLSADALRGRTFVTQEVTGYELAPNSTLTLSFRRNTMGASGGCNSMSGTYEIDGDQLHWVDAPATTEMACIDDALMTQDVWVADWLTAGVTAELDGDTLTLSADDVTVELLDEQVAVPDRNLVGTMWTLDTIITGETAASLPAGVEAPTLEIDANGRMSVFTGCNRGSATATIAADGASATLDALALTRMACPSPAATLEQEVVTVLQGEVALAVNGEMLTVTNGDNALVYRAS